MPIISSEKIDSGIFKIVLNTGYGTLKNIPINTDGIYNIRYMYNAKCINNIGRIKDIKKNIDNFKNSYILFDSSEDNKNLKRRIMFYQIQDIKDITPNNAYTIAVKQGFTGTVNEWLKSLVGPAGKSAYDIAVDNGFAGSVSEWLKYLTGPTGKSAYDIAVDNGFVGTKTEWLKSLIGPAGKSAYQIAVDNGYEGPEEDWMENFNRANKTLYEVEKIIYGFDWVEGMDGQLDIDIDRSFEFIRGPEGKSAYQIAVNNGFEGTEEEWLESLKGSNGKSAYQSAVDNGYESTEEEWLESLKGSNGKSAYQSAVDNGYEGTEEEWTVNFSNVNEAIININEIRDNIKWVEGMEDDEYQNNI